MADKDKKVFDVAKPGDSKPDIGSKPMIVGHKSMASDPMMRKDDESTTSSDDNIQPIEKKEEPNRTVKKKIEPLSDKESTQDSTKESEKDTEKDSKVESGEESAVKDSVDTDSKNDDKTPEESSQENSKADDNTTEEKDIEEVDADDQKSEKSADKDGEKKDGKEEAKLDPTAVAMEQEENLQKIIKSKKYAVDIKQKKSGGAGAFFMAFLLSLLVGIIALYLLIDSGIVNVDFDLPFSVFGN